MSPITRWHEGRAAIDALVLAWLEEELLMDTAEPRAVVHAAAEAERAESWTYTRQAQVHDLLDATEADAVQRLRGWNRARYGNLPVRGSVLSEVRNLIDGLTIGGDCTCRDISLGGDELTPEAAALLARGECARECNWAHLLILRDHLDAALDRLCPGFPCCAYYWTYQ